VHLFKKSSRSLSRSRNAKYPAISFAKNSSSVKCSVRRQETCKKHARYQPGNKIMLQTRTYSTVLQDRDTLNEFIFSLSPCLSSSFLSADYPRAYNHFPSPHPLTQIFLPVEKSWPLDHWLRRY